MSIDYTRGDSSAYDGCREAWASQREAELQARIDELEAENADIQRAYKETYGRARKAERKAKQLEAELAGYREAKQDERKTCNWQRYDSDWDLWQCSVCGVEWSLEAGTPFENDMGFCPKCGAKLETITERYFDYEIDDYVMKTMTREAAEAALQEGTE